MNKFKRLLPLSCGAALFLAAFAGCGKSTVGECVKQGTAAADAGDWETAFKFASKGVRCAPENVDALLLKAIAAHRCRRDAEAYDAAAKAAKFAPDNFYAQYTLGCVCAENDSRRGEAKRAFRTALKLRENDFDTLVAICNLTAEGEDPDLLKYLELLAKCSPKSLTDSATFSNQRGVALLCAGERDRALREFNFAQRKDINWDDPHIVYNAACAYDNYRLAYGRGNRRTIRSMYERYLQLTAGDKSAEPTRKLVQARVREIDGR